MPSKLPPRVRIIEDDKIIITLLLSLFSKNDIAADAVVVDNYISTEAMSQLFNPIAWAGITHAIVDLMLVNISGVDILIFLKAEAPWVKRIVFSAVAEMHPELRGLADMIFQKPVSHETLIQAVRGL